MFGDDLDGRVLVTPAELARYQDLLEELRRVRVEDARIAHLEELLREARVIDDAGHHADCVVPGRVVTVRYVSSGEEARYVIGVETPGQGLRGVSARSPVGRAILGRYAGDLVSAELPDGTVEELLVVSVTAAPQPC